MNDRAWTRWVMQSARTWDDISFIIRKTGIQMVDDDHRRLTEFALEINRFLDIMERDQVGMGDIERESELLQELYQYTEDHFAREEVLIERYGLEGLDNQKEHHRRILAMVSDRIQDFGTGRLTTALQLKLAILEWIVVHINQVDYGTFQLRKWRPVMRRARTWDDVSTFVRRMGVESVDQEHRALTELTLELNHALQNGAEEERVHGLFDSLSERAGEHFAHEERLMERYRIRELDTQAEQHRLFLDMLARFHEEFGEKGEILSAEFDLAVLEWWINHINELDNSVFNAEKWAPMVLNRGRTWDEVAEVIRTTGVAEVEEDHRRLVEIGLELNALIEGSSRGEEDEAAVGQVLQRLYDCAAEHFVREERIMEERGCANLDEHRKEHRQLLVFSQENCRDFRDRRLHLSEDLKVKILKWWGDHINGTDFRAFRPETKPAAAASGSGETT